MNEGPDFRVPHLFHVEQVEVQAQFKMFHVEQRSILTKLVRVPN